MRAGLRVAALFAAYSVIGFGGDYAAGLLAWNDDGERVDAAVRHKVEPQVEVVVDVRPEIVVAVRVRHSGECSYALDRQVTIPMQGVDRLNIDAGSGELHVEGQAGLDQIVVVGAVCASLEEWLDELRLTVEEGLSGDVTLVAHYPENRTRSRRNDTARIDLTVLVPLGLDVDIDDSSGDIEVSGTANLWIDDSSGSIQVRGVNGNLLIDDSSGGVQVEDVEGDVEIEDSSDGIDIRGVQGSVVVSDGSGGIDIAEVEQDVLIESDGSGGIVVRSVGGDFIVDRDGTGSISYSDVGGLVDVPEDRRRRRRRRRGGR